MGYRDFDFFNVAALLAGDPDASAAMALLKRIAQKNQKGVSADKHMLSACADFRLLKSHNLIKYDETNRRVYLSEFAQELLPA